MLPVHYGRDGWSEDSCHRGELECGEDCLVVRRPLACHGDDVSERSRISGHFLAVVACSEERHTAIDRIVEAKFLSVSVFEVFYSRIDKWLSGLVGLVREDCTCLEAP